MGRVQRRMYRRRRAWEKRLLITAVGIFVMVLMVFAVRRAPFVSELATEQPPDSMHSGFDKTIQTREVILEKDIWYAIQTGVFSTREAADQKAGAYVERGAPGVVIQDGEKWRVFIACYGKEADASAVRARLGEMQRVDTYLYEWTCPELRLRLTGMVGQLDVAEAGFMLLTSGAATLRDGALLLDAAQMTTKEAKQMADDLADQAELWLQTALERFGSRLPILVQDVQGLVKNWQASLQAIAGTDASATDVSAGMKLTAMEAYGAIVSWRAAMNEAG